MWNTAEKILLLLLQMSLLPKVRYLAQVQYLLRPLELRRKHDQGALS
jgi:hypothetical protein